MLSQRKRRKQAEAITQAAIKRYGKLRNRKARPPLNQLILGLLCRVTSVRRATRALNELKRAFVDWNEVRVSHPVEVAGALSSAQWALMGAEQLVWLLRDLYHAYSRIDLDFLAELTPTQARSCVKRLSTVQRDLADEVLLFSLGVPVLPFSADTARMCYRLGLIENDRPLLKNQKAVSSLLDEDYYATIHHFFCDHSGKICLADEPLCAKCPMRKPCPSAR